ncbi:MAG: hypothetical protein JWO80_1927 [Bryobacterales bacterium]|nr:hypothetical protein [Bryobacterales bacterium]
MMTQSVPGIGPGRSGRVRVAALIASCACLLSVDAQTPRAPDTGSLTPALAAERKVGIAYSTWHNSRPWGKTWGTPTLGQYLSNDPAAIRHHAEWLVSANVDFIYIDWSNDIDTGIPGATGQGRQIYLEETTTALFEQYTRLSAHPQVAIMIGFPEQPSALSDGRLRRKADQVWETLAHHPKYEGISSTISTIRCSSSTQEHLRLSPTACHPTRILDSPCAS